MIAQITWLRYLNYGTSLQAYALQKVLYQNGIISKIVFDDRFTYLAPKYDTFRKKLYALFNIRETVRYFRYWRSEVYPFSKFAKEYLKVDYYWDNTEILNSRYDGFICGSDQIWSPLLPQHHEGFYFAAFTDKIKVAYAPSLGCTQITSEYIKETKKWLTRFSKITMREDSSAILMSKLLDIEVKSVCDPTLLLSADEWKQIAIKPKVRESYILLYLLGKNICYIDYARKLAKKNNCLLISIGESKEFSDIPLNMIGPRDFLGLIQHATHVVTDSFHGLIFSILFRKPFIAFKRFKDNAENNQNERIFNLFSKLAVEKLYEEKDILNLKESGYLEFSNDFDLYNKRLDEYKSYSLECLNDLISEL